MFQAVRGPIKGSQPGLQRWRQLTNQIIDLANTAVKASLIAIEVVAAPADQHLQSRLCAPPEPFRILNSNGWCRLAQLNCMTP
jgi:hypothetical protein